MRGVISIAAAAAATPALAAEASLNGTGLSPLWIVPFAGIPLSIAVAPVTAPAFWHHHFGKTSAFWALAFLVPFAVHYGLDLAFHEVDDVQHWLSSPKREEIFGPMGITARTFHDPEGSNRVGLIVEIPDMAAFQELIRDLQDPAGR